MMMMMMRYINRHYLSIYLIVGSALQNGRRHEKYCYHPTKEKVHVFARVCLSVSKNTQNACMDSDEMLLVDVGTWMN